MKDNKVKYPDIRGIGKSPKQIKRYDNIPYRERFKPGQHGGVHPKDCECSLCQERKRNQTK